MRIGKEQKSLMAIAASLQPRYNAGFNSQL